MNKTDRKQLTGTIDIAPVIFITFHFTVRALVKDPTFNIFREPINRIPLYVI